MSTFLLSSTQVVIGAALGGLLRYWATLYLPLPILVVNVVGSLVIGYTYHKLSIHNPQLLPLINVGLLGGLTSFSSFSLDVMKYLQNGQLVPALLYILASVALCIVFCFIGYKLG